MNPKDKAAISRLFCFVRATGKRKSDGTPDIVMKGISGMSARGLIAVLRALCSGSGSGSTANVLRQSQAATTFVFEACRQTLEALLRDASRQLRQDQLQLGALAGSNTEDSALGFARAVLPLLLQELQRMADAAPTAPAAAAGNGATGGAGAGAGAGAGSGGGGSRRGGAGKGKGTGCTIVECLRVRRGRCCVFVCVVCVALQLTQPVWGAALCAHCSALCCVATHNHYGAGRLYGQGRRSWCR